ncbi:hypothetical protein CRYUN_Cryun41cG0063400 [Craigia yunnanensis]
MSTSISLALASWECYATRLSRGKVGITTKRLDRRLNQEVVERLVGHFQANLMPFDVPIDFEITPKGIDCLPLLLMIQVMMELLITTPASEIDGEGTKIDLEASTTPMDMDVTVTTRNISQGGTPALDEHQKQSPNTDVGQKARQLEADAEFSLNFKEHFLLTVNDADHHDGEMKFEIRDLRKVSNAGVPILNGINVGIPKGVIVGIIGPSGSGKSTLLRALNRLWEPPMDTVFLDGHDIVDLDVLGLRRKVGMLFQLPVLFQGTVADNIRYGPNLRGKKLTDEEVSKLLTLADLDSSFFSKSGGELSVGQAQRVALARTLANEPEVLLLDEPTSALDPISTQNIEDVIVKLKKKRGMTVVMVSHSIKQIQRVADVVCLLVNGEIVEVLKPDELSEAKHPMAQRFLQLSS